MIRKWTRRILIFLAAFICLIAGLLLFLHTPWGRKIVRNQAENYLEKKLQTKVSIGDVNYRLPNWIQLKKILVLDQKKDTLLSGGNLYVRLNMIDLLSRDVKVGALELENISLYIHRGRNDPVFNYQFISDAFSSGPDEDTTSISTGDPIRLNIHSVLLNNVFFRMQDEKGKEYYDAGINHLYCLPGRLDLEENSFEIKDLAGSGIHLSIIDSSISVNQTKETVQNTAAGNPQLLIKSGKLALRDIDFSYKKPSDKHYISTRLNDLRADQVDFNVLKQSVACKNLKLDNSVVCYSEWSAPNTSPGKKPVTAEKVNSKNDQWTIAVDAINLRNNSFSYHNEAIKPVPGFDPNHIDANGINFLSRQNIFDSRGFFSTIDTCSVVVNGRFQLKSLQSQVQYTDRGLQVKDLALAYNNSNLQIKGELLWPGETNALASTSVTQVENAVLSFDDILQLYPGLQDLLPVTISPKEKMTVSGKIKGPLQNCVVEDLRLNSDKFRFSGNVGIQSNSRNGDLVYHSSINELVVQKNFLSPSLLNQLKKQGISLPEKISLSGNVNGTSNQVITDLRMNSSYGQVQFKGDASDFNSPKNLRYQMQLQTTGLETGKWIGEEAMYGKLNGTITLKGKGTDPARMDLIAGTRINTIVINGYQYSNVDLSGKLNRGNFETIAKINDPNLSTDLKLNGSIPKGYVSLSGTVSIDRADIRALGFSTDTLVLSGIIDIDTLNTDPANFVASVFASNGFLNSNGKTVPIDSLEIKAHSKNNATELQVSTPFMDMVFNSSYSLEQTPLHLEQAIRQLYQNKVTGSTKEGWFNFAAAVQQDSLLDIFMPGLKLEQPVNIYGRLGSLGTDSSFLLKASAPSIRYQNFGAKSVDINAVNSDSGKVFTVNANTIYKGKDSIYKPSLDGLWKDDGSLVFSTRIEDEKQKELYALKAFLHLGEKETRIRLFNDVVLNRHHWTVPENNELIIRKNNVINAHNFSLSRHPHVIEINSLNSDSLSPLHIKVDSVDLGVLAALIALGDTTIASGKLNIDVIVQQPLTSFPIFTGKAGLYGLAFRQIPIGDLELQSKTSGDSLALEGKLTGANEADFSGSLHPAKEQLVLDASVRKLDLKIAQQFLKEYIPRAYGNLRADIHLSGSANSPKVNGMLYFDSTGFTLAELNTIYKIEHQQIAFDYPSVRFDDFVMSDSIGNRFSVNGDIKVTGPSEYGLNLKTSTKNFIALNSKRSPGSSLYGKAIVNADVSISGSSDEPLIEGTISLRPASDIHYVFNNNKTYSRGNERIRFVDIDTLPMPGIDTVLARDSLKIPKAFRGLMYNLNLEISKDAAFSILIDPASGDELMIKGEAQLNLGIEEDGRLGITGLYKLQSGYYNMKNQLLKGKFLLSKGSTINFNGDPYGAVADINTEYEVKCSPSGLLTGNEKNMAGAKENFLFLIVLTIKGPISKPELAFDIRLKEKLTGSGSSLQTAIDDELVKLRADESLMNKQVFSLLVLNQFTVYTQSDMSAADFNPDVMLREGMSQFLSEAMNQMADDLIKGVDVNVNFRNYKSEDQSGTKTDLGVSLSKNLANDRLTVTVGKYVTMGESTKNKYAKQTDQYIPDITTTYKLSRDGRYYMKVYRKNEYDAVVEGYFAETGVSFTIQMDYNHFKELFTREKKLQNP